MLAFNVYHFHRYPLILLILGGCVVSMLWRIFQMTPADTGIAMVVFKLIFSAVILGVFAWLLLLIIVALTLVTRLNSNVLTDHVVTLAEASVVEQTPQSRIETKWAGIQKVRSNRNYIFLYIAAHLAHVIPRRAFPDAASWQAANDFCVLSKQRSNK